MMKTNGLMAALLTLTVTAAVAQRQAPYANYEPPGYGRPAFSQATDEQRTPAWGDDNREEVFRFERLNRLVNLTGRQKRELFRIEQFYVQEASLNARHPSLYRRLMWQKSQDMLAVLSPLQRDRLFALEQYRPYRSYGNDYKYGRPGEARRN